MDLLFLIIAIIIGVIIGKSWFEQQKWSDKKKIIQQNHEKELMELEHEYEKEILEKDNMITERDKNFGIAYVKDMGELKDLVMRHEKCLRQDAVKRSRVSILGKVWEQIEPSLKNFPFQPEDAKFVGAPIDYIVFEGMGEKNIKKVHFVEIKSGNSKLNKQEKTLKDVIQKKKVYWREVRVGDKNQAKRNRLKQEEDKDVIGKHELYNNFEDKIVDMKKKLKIKNKDIEESEEEEYE